MTEVTPKTTSGQEIEVWNQAQVREATVGTEDFVLSEDTTFSAGPAYSLAGMDVAIVISSHSAEPTLDWDTAVGAMRHFVALLGEPGSVRAGWGRNPRPGVMRSQLDWDNEYLGIG